MIVLGMPPTVLGVKRGGISLRSSTVLPVNNAHLVMPKPAGVDLGDILVFWGVHSGSRSMIYPSGWTSRINSGASALSAFAATKIAGASEPASYSFNFNLASGAAVGMLLAYKQGSDHDITGSLARSASVATTAASGITATQKGVLLGFFASTANVVGGYTAPVGMAEKEAAAATGVLVAAFEANPSPVGATGNKTITWNISSGNHAGFLMQLF